MCITPPGRTTRSSPTQYRTIWKCSKTVSYTHLDVYKRQVCSNAGEGYIDTAVKVLIAVVLGALVRAGLYAILNDTVMPTVTQKITEMFSYNG